MNPAIIGALINSALYLVCVFVAGLVTGHSAAWKFAIAAIGLTFLVYAFQLSEPISEFSEEFRANMLKALIPFSWMFGLMAGLALLF